MVGLDSTKSKKVEKAAANGSGRGFLWEVMQGNCYTEVGLRSFASSGSHKGQAAFLSSISQLSFYMLL